MKLLLPPPYATDAANLSRQYIANRLELYNVGIDQIRLQTANDQATQLQQQLWSIAMAASAQDNRAVPTGLFVQTLNDVIIDLDRPRRGLILASQQSMINLQDFIAHDLP